ncbi:cell wall-binding repeat-containing protein, partial [Clostridioides difficile]|nr:cell wall-binding repeat-containing protein [Clostridioides difficile]MCW0591915.1 cell wall-binding repeat-containing protein [Clostridioides difficile]
MPPDTETKVTLVFTVTHTSSGKTADTGEIEVTVPARTAIDTEQLAVQAEADKITSVTQPTQDATTLTMPTVASGYTIKIKSSTNESVIAKDGTIVPPDTETKVTLVFTVTHTSSGKIADTGEIEVTVPARTAIDTEQLAVQAEADKITSVTQPTQDATTLTMPTVASGYTIKIKSSTNESVIVKDGTIVPPDTETKVTLVFTVTHTSSGKTADTGEIEVTVPART